MMVSPFVVVSLLLSCNQSKLSALDAAPHDVSRLSGGGGCGDMTYCTLFAVNGAGLPIADPIADLGTAKHNVGRVNINVNVAMGKEVDMNTFGDQEV